MQLQKISEEITIDKETKKAVIATVQTADLTHETSKEDIKRTLKKELADIVSKVKGYKAQAEKIKALLIQLDTVDTITIDAEVLTEVSL